MAGPIVLTEQTIDKIAEEVERRLPEFQDTEEKAKQILERVGSEELIVEGITALMKKGSG